MFRGSSYKHFLSPQLHSIFMDKTVQNRVQRSDWLWQESFNPKSISSVGIYSTQSQKWLQYYVSDHWPFSLVPRLSCSGMWTCNCEGGKTLASTWRQRLCMSIPRLTRKFTITQVKQYSKPEGYQVTKMSGLQSDTEKWTLCSNCALRLHAWLCSWLSAIASRIWTMDIRMILSPILLNWSWIVLPKLTFFVLWSQSVPWSAVSSYCSLVCSLLLLTVSSLVCSLLPGLQSTPIDCQLPSLQSTPIDCQLPGL